MMTVAAGGDPDLIMGHLTECQQFGRVGPVGSGTVGLAIGTTACNKGDEPIPWLSLPGTDHPVFVMNMYRLMTVDGPDHDGVFTFTGTGETVAESPALNAWPGVSQTLIEPAPMVDGRALLVYKASHLGNGLWRYEYAMYNMHLERSLGSLSIPVPDEVTLSSIGFHAPLNHAPEPDADNYGNDPWEVATTGGAITWSTDPFNVDPLANAVRWGTMYNFRFDANASPRPVDATVGLFKTGDTTSAATVGPSSVGPYDCNGNSIDDRCDLSCGLPGCSVSGCGQSENCTRDGIPDDCEPDCDGSGVPDACNIAESFSSSSPELSPVYYRSIQTFVISSPPPAGSDVTMSFIASANLGSDGDEYISVTLNNNLLADGNVFQFGAYDCSDPPDTDEIILAAEDFNALVGDGPAVIKMIPPPAVTPGACGASSYIMVTVTYETTGSPDCNGNLLPDQCDVRGDIDGDGHLSLADYARAVYCMSGPCVDPPCDGPLYADTCCALTDFDLDGDYDLADFRALQLGFADE